VGNARFEHRCGPGAGANLHPAAPQGGVIAQVNDLGTGDIHQHGVELNLAPQPAQTLKIGPDLVIAEGAGQVHLLPGLRTYYAIGFEAMTALEFPDRC